MRYNPDTDHAVSLDTIADQCRAAITRQPEKVEPATWAQMEQWAWDRWRSYGAGRTELCTRSHPESLRMLHAARVADAMGNRARARQIWAAFRENLIG